MRKYLDAAGVRRDLRRDSVLIVDRDESTLHLCSYLVLESGMSLYTGSSVSHALSTLANFPISLVVTNHDFPTLTAIDLIHHIRTNYPHIQVLVMTPFGDVPAAVRAVRAGATDYLMKPFSADEFQQKIRDWKEGRGTFSKWTAAQQGHLPETRTFIEASEIWMNIRSHVSKPAPRIGSMHAPQDRRRAAIVADAARTLQQLIERDIEETAMFAYIDEQELIAAYLALSTASNTTHGQVELCEDLSPDEDDPDDPN